MGSEQGSVGRVEARLHACIITGKGDGVPVVGEVDGERPHGSGQAIAAILGLSWGLSWWDRLTSEGVIELHSVSLHPG